MYDLLIFIGVLAAAYGIGSQLEARHYRDIRRRENELRHLLAIASKHLPADLPPSQTKLVAGSVVISVDYFKRFLAGLRNLVGGRVSSYESLIDRARREAVLRMKAEAAGLGALYVFNVKFETSSMYKGRRDDIGSVEVLVYGTAIIPQ